MIDLYLKEFKVGKDLYFFKCEKENIVEPKHIRYGWHISFGIVDDNEYVQTNKNIPFKVLSKVKNLFNQFLLTHKPHKFSFIAEGEQKVKIYTNMVRGYNYKKEHSGLGSFSNEIPYLVKMYN